MNLDGSDGMKTDNQKNFIKEAFYKGLTNLLVIICAILFFFLIYKLKDILSFVKRIFSILTPMILGVIFAYLVNPIEVYFETRLIKAWEAQSGKKLKKIFWIRLLSIILTIVLVGGIIYLLVYLAVPEIYSSITRIVYAVPGQMTKYYNILANMAKDNSWLREMLDKAYTSLMDFVTGWVREDMFSQITVIINGVFGVVGAVSNLLIGCIVAVYVLISKETFFRQFNLLLRAFFSDEASAKIKEIIHETDRIFGGFISGKILDSFIIGILYFIGASILRLPYTVLISVIIGVTNVIPVFGPYIGAIPSAILILLDSPAKGLIFIIYIIVLQQFDGNILGPKILGDSTGLSPFWVIFAIVLGSGLFGLIGMIIGVPAFAVVYYLSKRYIYYRLNKRLAAEAEEESGVE